MTKFPMISEMALNTLLPFYTTYLDRVAYLAFENYETKILTLKNSEAIQCPALLNI